VVERAYLATTACGAQDIFSKIIFPGYSQWHDFEIVQKQALFGCFFGVIPTGE